MLSLTAEKNPNVRGSCLLVKYILHFVAQYDLQKLNGIFLLEGFFIEIPVFNSIFITIYRISDPANLKQFVFKLEQILH